MRGEIDYLVRTHDASTRDSTDVRAIKKTSKTTMWLGLEIIATEAGGSEDETGIVEFIARGVSAGKPFALRERSRFRRVDGEWFYVDAI